MKSTLEVQILAYPTSWESWIAGNVAVHIRKVDNPKCKSSLLDGDTIKMYNVF